MNNWFPRPPLASLVRFTRRGFASMVHMVLMRPRTKYRAFVASTRRDLERQRIHVIERLRKADLDVIGMEDWTADPDHPAELSARNISGCHFCVAIIGFQRGTLSTQDAQGRSITQIEIDTARTQGVRILTFVLRNTEQNRQAWPVAFNQLADERVQRWRQEFETETTSEFFDAAELPDVLPAVTRQITKWEQRQRSRLQRLLAGVIFALGIMVLLVGMSAGARDWLLSRLHSYHDPIAFQHSRDGQCKVARLLEGRSDIQDNTNFREEILATRESFCMFANTFSIYRDYETDFKTIVVRGVRLRVVLTDFAETNRTNWEGFNQATEGTPRVNDETLANAANIREMIHKLRRDFPDRVEIRLHRRPLLFTLWVRDPLLPSGLAHLGVLFYGQKANWPAFRVSQSTGGAHLAAASAQFERIWVTSAPDERPQMAGGRP